MKCTLYHQLLAKYIWKTLIYTDLIKKPTVFVTFSPIQYCYAYRVAPNSPDLNQLDYKIWVPWWNSSCSPRWLMSWKSLCRPSGKSWTCQQGRGKLHQELDWVCACKWWSIQASAVTLSISKSAASSQHIKPALLRATHILPEKTTFETLKNRN